MKSFAALIPALGLVAGVQAWANETTWTTTTVQTLTTYCPEATTFTHGTKTYTATAHETLTITDCPCTISKPVKPTHSPIPPPASTYVPHPPYPTTTAESHPTMSVTITVSEYTTYCPYPTTIPVGPNSTITVTEPTTLTISKCPCTLTKPAVVTTTISYYTTYCPAPTTVTIGTETHTLPSGTVTIPIEHTTTVPAPEQTQPASSVEVPGSTVVVPIESAPSPPAATETEQPAITSPVATVPAGTGSLPNPSTTAPLQANNAVKRDAGFGAVLAAGLIAALM